MILGLIDPKRKKYDPKSKQKIDYRYDQPKYLPFTKYPPLIWAIFQEFANYRVGTDYPQPILNHKTARAQNIKQIEELNSQMEQMNL